MKKLIRFLRKKYRRFKLGENKTTEEKPRWVDSL